MTKCINIHYKDQKFNHWQFMFVWLWMGFIVHKIEGFSFEWWIILVFTVMQIPLIWMCYKLEKLFNTD